MALDDGPLCFASSMNNSESNPELNTWAFCERRYNALKHASQPHEVFLTLVDTQTGRFDPSSEGATTRHMPQHSQSRDTNKPRTPTTTDFSLPSDLPFTRSVQTRLRNPLYQLNAMSLPRTCEFYAASETQTIFQSILPDQTTATKVRIITQPVPPLLSACLAPKRKAC